MFKYRAEITKEEEIRYISHLDYAALIERAICRAKLPAAYSEGFNPHLKLAFASALAVGVTSGAEYMDFELKEAVEPLQVMRRLRAALPPGVKVNSLRLLTGKAKALMAETELAVYRVTVPLIGERAEAERAVEEFNRADGLVYHRVTPKKTRDIEVKQYINDSLGLSFIGKDAVIVMKIVVTPTGSIKPGEILGLLQKNYGLPVDGPEAVIHREKLLGGGKPLIELD